MSCKMCLKKFANKIQQTDLMILDYLSSNGATNAQFSFSKDAIKEHFQLTIHNLVTSLGRLETLDLIVQLHVGRVLRYYITDDGVMMLRIIEEATR